MENGLRSKDLIGKDVRFVLAASGHVAGVINPPARNKRSHWLNDELVANPQSWLDSAQEKPGSWWPDWDAWMKRHSDGVIPAPNQQGNARYSPIEPAPGRYVKAKSNSIVTLSRPDPDLNSLSRIGICCSKMRPAASIASAFSRPSASRQKLPFHERSIGERPDELRFDLWGKKRAAPSPRRECWLSGQNSPLPN